MWSNGFQIAGGGSAFPSAPATNDIFFRTDLGSLYYYDGSAWQSLGVLAPIGSIIAWAKNIVSPALALPRGWVECDGSALTDTESPLYGILSSVPDLNGTAQRSRFQNGHFLRGYTALSASDPNDFQADDFLAHVHSLNSHTHGPGSLGVSPNPHSHQQSLAVAGSGSTGNANVTANAGTGNAASQHTVTTSLSMIGNTAAASGNTGQIGGAETRPMNFGVTWIMRIK